MSSIVKRGYSLNNQSDKELIQQYLLYGDKASSKLSPSLADNLEKMRSCAELIRQYGSSQKTVTHLVARFGISLKEAYNIYNDTQEIFGTTTVHNREFMVDVVIGNIFQTRKLALERKDLKVVAQCDKNLIEVIEKFLGDKEAVDWSKIQPPAFMFGFFPELSNVELPKDWEKMLDKLLKKKGNKTFDISYEDATGDNGGSTEATS